MVLSGAGLSAESGISTFRDSNGLWENYDVMQVCSTRGLITRFYNDRRRELVDKKPNAMHLAIARLEEVFPGRIWNLTQNIDDLLECAGCRRYSSARYDQGFVLRGVRASVGYRLYRTESGGIVSPLNKLVDLVSRYLRGWSSMRPAAAVD